MGEMAIRAGTAQSVVFYLKMGMGLAEAGRRAMEDLNDLGGRFLSEMRFIALDKHGNHAGFSSTRDKSYIFQQADMVEADEVGRTYMPLQARWDRGS